MLEYKEQLSLSQRSADFIEYLPTEGKTWNPPIAESLSLTHHYPIRLERYGKIWTDNDRKTKGEWKPFQMYKHWIDRSRFPGISDAAQSYLSITGGPFYLAANDKHINPEFAYWDSDLVLNWGPLGAHIKGHQALTEVQPDGGFIPKPQGVEDLIDRSLQVMLPRIKADLSLVNTIIELKDFKSLPQTFAKFRDFARNSLASLNKKQVVLRDDRLRSVRQSFGKVWGPTCREATNTGADVYLQSQFNILPLLADMSGIHSALVGAQKKANALLAGAGKRQIKHFKVFVPFLRPSHSVIQESSVYRLNGHQQFEGQTNAGANPGVENQPYTSFHAQRYISRFDGVFHAQIEYDYSYNAWQTEYASILVLLDRLGVNLNPAIIWNALPWSFVIDWVAGVGRWLNGRTSMNMEPATNIRRYLWSIDINRITELTLRCHSQGSGLAYKMPGVAMLPCRERAFRRDIGVPTTSSLISSGLSLKELSLGAALLVPRRWRPNRGRSPQPKRKNPQLTK